MSGGRTKENILLDKGIAELPILRGNTICIAVPNRNNFQSVPEILESAPQQSALLAWMLMVVSDVVAAMSGKVSIAEEYMSHVDGTRTLRHKAVPIEAKKLMQIAAGGGDTSSEDVEASLTFNPDTDRVLGKEYFLLAAEFVSTDKVHTKKAVRKVITRTGVEKIIREWTYPAGQRAVDSEPVGDSGTYRQGGQWEFGGLFVRGEGDDQIGDVYAFGDGDGDASPEADERDSFVETEDQEPYAAITSVPDVAEIRFYLTCNQVVTTLIPAYAARLMQAMQRRNDYAGGDAVEDDILRRTGADSDASVSSDVVCDNMMKRASGMWSVESIHGAVQAMVGYQNMVMFKNPLKGLFTNLAPERVIAATEIRFTGIDCSTSPSPLCCNPRQYGLQPPTDRVIEPDSGSSVQVLRFPGSVVHPLTGQNMTPAGITRLMPMFEKSPDRLTLCLQFTNEMMQRDTKFLDIYRLFYNTSQEEQLRVFDDWVEKTRAAKASRGNAVLRLQAATTAPVASLEDADAPAAPPVASRMTTWADPIGDTLRDAAAGGAFDGEDGLLGGGQLGDDDLGDEALIPSPLPVETGALALASEAPSGADGPIPVGPDEKLGVHHLATVLGMNPPTATEMSQCRVQANCAAVNDLLLCPLDSTDRAVLNVASLRQAFQKQVEPFQKDIYTMTFDGMTPLDPANEDKLFRALRSKAEFHRQLLESQHQALDRTLGAPNPVEVYTRQMKKSLREMKRRLAKEGGERQLDSLASRSVGGFMRAHAGAGTTIASRFYTMLMTEIGVQMNMVDHHDLVALVWTSSMATASVCRLNHPAPNLIITGKPGLGKSNILRQTMRLQSLAELVGSASDQATVSEESNGSGTTWTDEFTPESRGLAIKARGRGRPNQANNTLEATWKMMLEAGWCSRKVTNLNKHDRKKGRTVDKLKRRSTALYVEIGNLEPDDFSDALLDRYEIYYWVRQRRLDGLELTAAEIANDETTDDMVVLQYMQALTYRHVGLQTRMGSIDVPTVKFGGTVLAAFQSFMDDDMRGKKRCVPMFNGWSPRTARRCRSLASGISQIRAVTISYFLSDNGLVFPSKITAEAYRDFLCNALNVVTEADAVTAFIMYSSVMVPTSAPVMVHCLEKALLIQQFTADRSGWKTKYPWDVPETALSTATAISSKSSRIMPDHVMLEIPSTDGHPRSWDVAKVIVAAATDRDGLEVSAVSAILSNIMKEWPKDAEWLDPILKRPQNAELHPVDARLKACDAFGFDIVGAKEEAYVEARNKWGGVLTDADTAEARRVMARAGADGRGRGGNAVGNAFMAAFNGGRQQPAPVDVAPDYSDQPRNIQIAIMREELARKKEFIPRTSRMTAFSQVLTETEEDESGGVSKHVRTFFVIHKGILRLLQDPASVFALVVKNCATPYTREQTLAVPVFTPGMPSVPRRVFLRPNPHGTPYLITNKEVTRAEDAASDLQKPPQALGVPSLKREMQRRVVVYHEDSIQVPIEECIDKTAHMARLTAAGLSPNQVFAVSKTGKVYTPMNAYELEGDLCRMAEDGTLDGLDDVRSRSFPTDYMGSAESARKVVAYAESMAPGCTGMSMDDISAVIGLLRKPKTNPWDGDDEEDLNTLPSPPACVGGGRFEPSEEDFDALPDDDIALDEEEEIAREMGLATVPRKPNSQPPSPPTAAPAAVPPPPKRAFVPVQANDTLYDDDGDLPDISSDEDEPAPVGKRGTQKLTDDVAPPGARRRRLE